MDPHEIQDQSPTNLWIHHESTINPLLSQQKNIKNTSELHSLHSCSGPFGQPDTAEELLRLANA